MYLLIEIRHNSIKQCHGNYIEAEKLLTIIVLPRVHPTLLYSATPMSRSGCVLSAGTYTRTFYIDAAGAGTCGAGLEKYPHEERTAYPSTSGF